MVSALDCAKRALVALIRALVTTYGCNIHVTRDSSDAELTKAYRKLSLKVHPDRGGDEERQKERERERERETESEKERDGERQRDRERDRDRGR